VGTSVGKLFGVGIGPGDPKLLTLKAIEVVRQADIICTPVPRRSGESMALKTISPIIKSCTKKHQVWKLHFPMVQDEEELRKVWESHAEKIAQAVEDGKSVAFIVLGDPTLYSTFFHFKDIIATRHPNIPIEVVPGVSFLTSCAARLGIPLAANKETLAVIPVDESMECRELVELTNTAVFIKRISKGLHFFETLAKSSHHRNSRVYLASKQGMEGERVEATDLTAVRDRILDLPYFSTMIVKRNSVKEERPHGVVFIGAGSGDRDLITVKGRRVLEQADVVIYAGSLINRDLLDYARTNAEVYDSSRMNHEELVSIMKDSVRKGKLVARLHSGDLSLYSALQEQVDSLRKYGIESTVIPGVSSYAAAAASLRRELTLPTVSQTLIITRPSGRIGKPARESIASLAKHNSTMVIFLGVHLLDKIVKELVSGGYHPNTPVTVVYRASWPDEKIIKGTLLDIRRKVRKAKIKRTAIIIVGKVLEAPAYRSKLYDSRFTHKFRKGCP